MMNVVQVLDLESASKDEMRGKCSGVSKEKAGFEDSITW
jgi:hypothetical protein